MHAHIGAFRIDGDVIREDPAAEAGEDARDDRADLARANESDCAAVHVESEEAIEREVAFADSRVRAVNLAVEAQHHRDGVLGDRMWGIRRHSRDRQAELSRFWHIDVVEPG